MSDTDTNQRHTTNMTAQELIELLKQVPPDEQIYGWNDEFGCGVGLSKIERKQWTDFFSNKKEKGLVLK